MRIPTYRVPSFSLPPRKVTGLAALVESLAPWVQALVTTGRPSCALVDPAHTEHGVVFRFYVHAGEQRDRTCFGPSNPLDQLQDTAAAKLREAIDIIYRVLALDIAAAMHLKVDPSHPWSSVSGLSGSVMRVLKRDAPFRVVVVFDALEITDAAPLLQRKIVDAFLVAPTHTPSTDPAYLAAKQTLDALLEEKNPRWAERLVCEPIRLHCCLTKVPYLALDASKSEMLFHALQEFAKALDEFEPPTNPVQGHLPVQVAIETMRLPPLAITHRVVASVVAISNLRRVRLPYCTLLIDPYQLACRRDELRSLLQALAKGGLEKVAIDWVPCYFEVRASDFEVEMTQLIEDLLLSVTNCEPVVDLDLAKLVISLPKNRVILYQALIETVLSRRKPMRLRLGYAETDEVDARAFAALVATWRADHPGAKLRLQRLEINCSDANYAFTNDIIAALDEVEELSVRNTKQDAPVITTDQVRGMLEKFQTLQVLQLTNVRLESMQLFVDASPPTLHTINLCGLHLTNRRSLRQYFESLGSREQPIAQQLRHLTLSEFASERTQVTLRLDDDEARTFAAALDSNRALETVNVILDADKQNAPLEFLTRTHGSIITACPAVRRRRDNKERRLAFLSVLYKMRRDSHDSNKLIFDPFLVREVFAFSDPWVARSIRAMRRDQIWFLGTGRV